MKFAFRCMSGGFDPDFAMNEDALQVLAERLREIRGVRRIRLEGLISRRGPERYDGVRRSHGDSPRRLSPEELAHRLAQRRAEGVRAALIGEGFDPSIIEAIGRDDELGLDHREECLPPNEDVGSWQRYVRVNVVVCEPPSTAR